MRVCLLLVVFAAGVAAAEPPRIRPACGRIADAVASKSAEPARRPIRDLVARRCEQDRWSIDVETCFAGAANEADGGRCLGRLTKPQLRLFEGDADRLGGRFAQWVFRRSVVVHVMPLPHTDLMLTAAPNMNDDGSDVAAVRALHDQGVAAYQAGKFSLAVQKFSAALGVNAAPELMYHLAQAYRLKGDRRRALELYDHYLDVAPAGAAAADCRAQLEKLRDQLP